jgi:hypothetical protein
MGHVRTDRGRQSSVTLGRKLSPLSAPCDLRSTAGNP